MLSYAFYIIVLSPVPGFLEIMYLKVGTENSCDLRNSKQGYLILPDHPPFLDLQAVKKMLESLAS